MQAGKGLVGVELSHLREPARAAYWSSRSERVIIGRLAISGTGDMVTSGRRDYLRLAYIRGLINEAFYASGA